MTNAEFSVSEPPTGGYAVHVRRHPAWELVVRWMPNRSGWFSGISADGVDARCDQPVTALTEQPETADDARRIVGAWVEGQT